MGLEDRPGGGQHVGRDSLDARTPRRNDRWRGDLLGRLPGPRPDGHVFHPAPCVATGAQAQEGIPPVHPWAHQRDHRATHPGGAPPPSLPRRCGPPPGAVRDWT